jgi:hypothetical protein
MTLSWASTLPPSQPRHSVYSFNASTLQHQSIFVLLCSLSSSPSHPGEYILILDVLSAARRRGVLVHLECSRAFDLSSLRVKRAAPVRIYSDPSNTIDLPYSPAIASFLPYSRTIVRLASFQMILKVPKPLRQRVNSCCLPSRDRHPRSTRDVDPCVDLTCLVRDLNLIATEI